MYNTDSNVSNEYLRDIYRIHLLNETLMALHQELLAVAVPPLKDTHTQEIYDLKPNNELRRDSVDMIAIEQPTVKHSRDDMHVDNRTMVPRRMKSAVLFTMDSIYSYEQNSLTGGASGVVTHHQRINVCLYPLLLLLLLLFITGELIVRKALEYAFDHFGARIDVLRSDRDFNRCKLKNYDIIILDVSEAMRTIVVCSMMMSEVVVEVLMLMMMICLHIFRPGRGLRKVAASLIYRNVSLCK